MKKLVISLAAFIILTAGCNKPVEPRVNVREGVASDTLLNNYLTRPVAVAFSALIGEGIILTDVQTNKNDAGLLEVYVSGFNKSYGTKKFRYRVEWLDEKGLLIETKTSVWLPMSAMGKQPFSFKVVAPRPDAVNYRMDTRKWE